MLRAVTFFSCFYIHYYRKNNKDRHVTDTQREKNAKNVTV